MKLDCTKLGLLAETSSLSEFGDLKDLMLLDCIEFKLCDLDLPSAANVHSSKIYTCKVLDFQRLLYKLYVPAMVGTIFTVVVNIFEQRLVDPLLSLFFSRPSHYKTNFSKELVCSILAHLFRLKLHGDIEEKLDVVVLGMEFVCSITNQQFCANAIS